MLTESQEDGMTHMLKTVYLPKTLLLYVAKKVRDIWVCYVTPMNLSELIM